MGVDDRYSMVALQAICMREIDCILSSEDLRTKIPRETVLQRFVAILFSTKVPTSLEKVISLYLPGLNHSTPFDDPDASKPCELTLLEELASIDESQWETACILHSYLCKIHDASELSRVLAEKLGRINRADHSKEGTVEPIQSMNPPPEMFLLIMRC